MNTRFFSFGCSLTSHIWPTYADIISLNFDEYYPRGRGGASNYYILNKFLESYVTYNFKPETDFVLVMLTGINRFSWKSQGPNWHCGGDLSNIVDNPTNEDHVNSKALVESIWNQNWAIHITWITASTIKKILTEQNIRHKIVRGIDFDFYLEPKNIELFNLDNESIWQLQELQKLIDNSKALQSFSEEKNDAKIYIPELGYHDGHPTPDTHLEYVKEFFPEFYNESVNEKFKDLCVGLRGPSMDKFNQEFHDKLCQYVRIFND